MTSRLPLYVLAPLLAAGTAYAQAPGEYEQTSAPGEVAPQPVAGSPCGGYAQINPMAHRIAVGLNFGSFVVAPNDAPEGSETEFHGAELAIRYRMSRRWELLLAFSGGRQVIDTGDGEKTEGDLATDSVTLGARFRFMPEQKWNWFVTGGFGRTVVANHTASKEERDALARPHAMLGIGLERRFQQFALQIEARGYSIGPRDNEAMVPTKDVPTPAPGGRQPVPASPTTMNTDELGGGSFTIGASYYF